MIFKGVVEFTSYGEGLGMFYKLIHVIGLNHENEVEFPSKDWSSCGTSWLQEPFPAESCKGRHESLFWVRAVLDIYMTVHLCTYQISNGFSDRSVMFY